MAMLSSYLEDVHVGGVADGAHVGRGALRADELDGRRPHVHHQRVDQLEEVDNFLHDCMIY